MAGFLVLTAAERGFVVLALVVAALLALSTLFGAGALLLRLRNDRAQSEHARLVSAWEPALLDVLAGARSKDSLHALVEPPEVLRFLTFLVGYSRRLRGEERAIVHELAAPYLPKLVPLTRRGGAEARGLAVQTLATLGMGDHADAVAAALDDPSPVVAMMAARGLYRRGQEHYFPAVLERLPRFTLWTRPFLASVLARGGPASAPRLRSILADRDKPMATRAVVADVLRMLNDIESVAVATEILEAELDTDLVAACLRLVRQLGHADHLPLLRARAASADPVIRAMAVGALGEIGDQSDVPRLQTLLDDPTYWVSLEAARGLMALGAVETLERVAASGGAWSTLAQQVLGE